jgi:hypothetical protein
MTTPDSIREAAANAIRTFCQSLGAGTVAVSSDGVERIYYAGLSLDALSVAVALALSAAKTDRDGVIEAREQAFYECLGIIDEHLNGHTGPQYRAACENIGRQIVALKYALRSPAQEGPKP